MLWFAFASQDGRTPILIAAEKGYTDFVRTLSAQYDGDVFHNMKVHIIIGRLPAKHLHIYAYTITSHISHNKSTIVISSRTPRMPSTWQPTEATYLSCSTSVLSLETECLTGMKMVRLAWTLLAGWDEMTLQNSSQRTTHNWRGRWVGGRHRSELRVYKCGKGCICTYRESYNCHDDCIQILQYVCFMDTPCLGTC